jgi:hypothetical protein
MNFIVGFMVKWIERGIGCSDVVHRKINILKLFVIFHMSAGSTPAASTIL